MRVEPCVFLLAVLLSGTTGATEPPANLQLLEFLGEFTTADGEWIDPLALDNADQNDARQQASGSNAVSVDDDLENEHEPLVD